MGRVYIKWNITYESESRSVMSNSFPPLGLYSPWNSPGQNTGVGSLFLQGIFPTQGLNPGIPHCRWILYQLSHKGSPQCREKMGTNFKDRLWSGSHCNQSTLLSRLIRSVIPISSKNLEEGDWRHFGLGGVRQDNLGYIFGRREIYRRISGSHCCGI